MMKNILFYTIAVLFDRQVTPKVNRCFHIDIRYSTFDIRKSRDKLSSRIITTTIILIIIGFGDTVMSHLTKCDTNSKEWAISN